MKVALGMSCLYASDYGPPDPSFDPFAGNGAMLQGFEGHAKQLATAQNRGQLEAMKRKLAHGEAVAWCDQGYGWVYGRAPAELFDVLVAVVIVPWIIFRILPRLRHGRDRARDWLIATLSPQGKTR
jgi:hypothetical protein